MRIGSGTVLVKFGETRELLVPIEDATLVVSTDGFEPADRAMLRSFHSSGGADSFSQRAKGCPFRHIWASMIAACRWSSFLVSTSFCAPVTGIMSVTFSGFSALTP